MTRSFIRRCGLDESVTTPKSYEYMDIIESAYDAMHEGIVSMDIFSTSSTYTSSLIQELLDNVRAVLIEMVQRVLSVISNFYINNVRVMLKYEEVLIDRLSKHPYPITHDTYEYPSLTDYPAVVKVGVIEKEINALHKEITNPKTPPTAERVGGRVNAMLRNFGQSVTGKPVDAFNLKESVNKVVSKKMKGKKTNVVITADTITAYMKEINNYKADRAAVEKTKKAIIEEYTALKQAHEKATENPMALAKNTIAYKQNPKREEFLSLEYNRFSDIHIEMMRLFNGYITIYETAFTTALNEMQDRINDRRNLLNQIVTATGLFAAVNTKPIPQSGQKPIPYMPTQVWEDRSDRNPDATMLVRPKTKSGEA